MLNEVFVGFSTTAGAGGLRSPIAYNLSMRYRHSMRGRRLFAGLLSAAMVWFSASVGVDAERQMDDEEFVRLLAVAEADKAVDRKRLSRLFFSIASTLNAGKNNVRLLQARLSFRDPSQEGVRDLSESRYDAYVANLVGFQSNCGRLLDEPGSDLVFYAAMMDGLQACWALDRYSRVVETYGAASKDLLTVSPSLEGCARFRRVVFAPPVQAILRDSLTAPNEQRAKIRELQEDLAALEELLRDLAAIEDED